MQFLLERCKRRRPACGCPAQWEGRTGIYVEDIFVSEWARGHNIGRRLLAAISALAEARGCTRVDLSVLHWNPARAFYERLGFAETDEWRRYRLHGDALSRLAAEVAAARRPDQERSPRE